MRRWPFILALGLLIGWAAEGHSQPVIRFALQVGLGVDIPVGEFADLAENGTGLSIGTGFPLAGNLAVYLGYTRKRFDSDVFGGDLTDSGFSGGLSFVLPGFPYRFQPWIGGGGVLHGLDIENATQQPDDWNLGVGLGGGVLVPINASLRLSPSVGFLRYETDIPGHGETAVSYVTAGVSVNVGL